MADTFTPNAKLILMEQGSRQNSWKTDFDNELMLPLDAILGTLTAISVTSSDVTLTETQTQSAGLTLSGTLTGSRAIIMPGTQARTMIIDNRCIAGTNQLTVKQASGIGSTELFYGLNYVSWDGTTGAPRVGFMPAPGITDVASVAGTTLIGNTITEHVRVTGTNGITGFGWAPAGTKKIVRFAGSLLLTHNATSFILIGGANITTQADDRSEFVSLGSGNWFMSDFTRASGLATVAASVATAAEIWAGTATKLIQNDVLWSAFAPVAVTYAASITLDLSTGINFNISALTGNLSLAFSNGTKVGQAGRILIPQDGTGSRILTLSGNWLTDGGIDPVLSTAASANDVLFYEVISSGNVYCSLARRIS